MNAGHKKLLTSATAFVLLAVLVEGCSFLGITEDTKDSTSFKTGSAANSDASVVPAEIASDIFKISDGDSAHAAQGQDQNATTDGKATSEPVPAPVTDTATDSRSPAAETSPAASTAPDASPAAAASLGSSKSHKRAARHHGKTISYKVKRGDTLMKIAFDKYSDLNRWHEIYEANKDRLHNVNFLPVGTVLAIHGVEYVVIEKNGMPYLIRRHDTLVKISDQLYGTPKKWRTLWRNNPQLIHDPNKIYAGFTLYYLTEDGPKPVPQNQLTKDDSGSPSERTPATQKQ